MPAHSVQVPGAPQVHRNARGVATTLAAANGVKPGAAASEGSAPIVENACGAPGAKGAGTTTGPGAAVTCAKGCRASLESLSARIRNGDTMRTVIANLSLTARIPSPSISREQIQPHSISQDKSDGLGYNRDLIGAAQALRFDSAPANRHQRLNPIESNCVIGVVRKWRATPRAGRSDNEDRSNTKKQFLFYSCSAFS